MTFTELVTEIMSRLNLSSPEAQVRVGRAVNRKYRLITTSIGLQMSRRITTSKAVTIGSSFVTFTGVEKLINVQNRNVSPYRILSEVTVEELQALGAGATTDNPLKWAPYSHTATTITALLDVVPETAFILHADAHTAVVDLSGTDTPAFPESYHDIIIEGVIADESRKMEKGDLAKMAQSEYDRLLSDLKFWIIKSGYLDTYQGRLASTNRSASNSSVSSGSSTGTIGGSGTLDVVAKFTQGTVIGDSNIAQSGSKVLINDTANANNTAGLTVNQAATDDDILTLKSSDVTTGLSSAFTTAGVDLETDDFGTVRKRSATVGGLRIAGIMEDTGTDRVLGLYAIGGTATSGKSAGASGLIDIYAAEHDGANNPDNIAADGNVVVISAQVGGAKQARWLVDEDGDTWQAGGVTSNGPTFINDSSNVNNVQGITINQLANDDHILNLKSSDVATAIGAATPYGVETDDFLTIAKQTPTEGGVRIQVLHENAATSPISTHLAVGGTATAVKSTAGRSLIEFAAAQHNGAGTLANITADGNVFGVRARVGGSESTLWMVDEDGDTWQSGALDLSAATSGQIVFPASQNASSGANTLDDYEEGTWTPTITSAGGGAPTYTTQVGYYNKIGKLVTAFGRVTLATIGTLGAGAASISGLPFTSQNSSSLVAPALIGFHGALTTAVVWFGGSNNPNTTTIGLIYKAAAATGVTVMNVADLSGTTDIIFSIKYLASA